eukprot:SAG31_NODE_26373_length_443_cov_1.197674_1_plen_69_part_00
MRAARRRRAAGAAPDTADTDRIAACSAGSARRGATVGELRNWAEWGGELRLTWADGDHGEERRTARPL